MNANTMWKNYRAIAGAHNYIIGFEYNGSIYAVQRKQVKQFLTYEKASRGQGYALRLRFKVTDKKRLATNAINLGNAEQLQDSIYNKGDNFERLVAEYYGIKWQKNNTCFTECGDLNINGTEYQVKFDAATFTNEKILERLRRA